MLTSGNLKNMPPPTPNRGYFMSVELNHDDCLSVCNMVDAITTLAILSSDTLHIFVKYSPHVKSLNIQVYAVNVDYTDHHYPCLFDKYVYFDIENSLEELKALEDKLIELVAEEKDRAIGAC